MIFDKCLEKFLGSDSHPTYECICVVRHLVASKICFTGYFIKISQIYECVKQDGKPHSTLVCIYAWVGAKLQVMTCQVSKFTLDLVFTDD